MINKEWAGAGHTYHTQSRKQMDKEGNGVAAEIGKKRERVMGRDEIVGFTRVGWSTLTERERESKGVMKGPCSVVAGEDYYKMKRCSLHRVVYNLVYKRSLICKCNTDKV